MKTQDDRHERWLAYYLGELPEADHARTEAELHAAPEEADHYRRVCEGVHDWANEAVPHEPLDAARIVQTQPAYFTPRKQWWTSAVPWATAAMFLLALSQISFSLSIGDTTLAWGQPAATSDDATTSTLLERLQTLEAAAETTHDEVQTVALHAVAIEDELRSTTEEIVYNQQLESEARYRDIHTVMSLAGLSSRYELAMAEDEF